jgi:hypothetical protein
LNKNILRLSIYIIFFLCFYGCSKESGTGWRNKYFTQAKKRVTNVEKWYEFKSGEYVYDFEFKKSELYNEKEQKICHDSSEFFTYDSPGRLIEERLCMRNCDNPLLTKYYFDSNSRLIKVTDTWPCNLPEVPEEKTFRLLFYDTKNLLIKEVWGNEDKPTTETYSYDNKSRVICKVKDEFNTNIKKWLIYIDSMYYNENDKLILNKRREIGKDLLVLTKYTYQDTILTAKEDTTITSLEIYKDIRPNTVHSAYFNRTEYKYNSDGKLAEKIVYQPDYKTPHQKIVYEHITEWLK